MTAIPSESELARRFSKFHGKKEFCCHATKPYDGTHYVGVYLGWRGSLNILRLDLQQGAAVRLSENADLPRVLSELRDSVKPPNENPSRLVLIGHSFGGLILERTINRLYQNRPSGAGAVLPFADLAVTYNEATNGVLAKRIIEKSNAYSAASLTVGNTDKPPRPLLIGIHSKSDPLTGPFGTFGRRFLPTPHPRDNGVYEEAEYRQSGDRPDAGTINRSTPSNLLYFDSLCYLDDEAIAISKKNKQEKRHDFVAGDPPGCNDVSDIIASGKVQRSELRLFPSMSDSDPLSNIYRRVQYSCRGMNELYKGDNRPLCKPCGQDSDESDFNLLPWNRSAYWMMNVPDNVISAHGGYWHPNSVALLQALMQKWPVLKRGEWLDYSEPVPSTLKTP